jgi:XTP/dITP diphosphohydrolase
MKLLIATENQGKVREIKSILADLDVELVTPKSLGLDLKVVEDGADYAENAAKKARIHARASGLISLADDSGLEVDALDGAPGLHSARYSPKPNATDADRRAYLLANLKDRPRPWTARFRATVVIASPDGVLGVFEGECPGEIIPDERGSNGFGYDPIFFMRELNQTMAELPESKKNRLSHRGRAVEKARELLRGILK